MTVYHRILADERRRIAIEVLNDRSSVSLDELAEEVALRGGGSPETVRISLHHHHLPLLDEVGVVDYDSDRTRITAVQPKLTEVSELSRFTAASSHPHGYEVYQ